ncbi:Fur family ferric uptake regulator [Janibacter hoylei PVAS-1]|uniref:Fur family ferric uptake regulator n=1 Tax=Janibacter hoylei PVAS-1 TaxID=1210046 RepID=K1E452_9MICO|nr:Fur family transcriptional regulator [Janibacter hoylei]EKA61801.1 Fur family ferric uptake regulator [Janibacter hoylei PVAS-1]RWU85516.1 transcriptional repressor [Janibacter hoylei PVAS-1]
MTDTRTRRPTRQRTAIEADVDRSDEFRSAQEIHASLVAGGDKIGLATVYRTLQAMVDEEALDSLRTDDGEIVYRRCSTGHHHHLVCRDCARTVEVEGPAVERWADKVSAEHGFSDVSHTLELFGRCGDCG